MTHDDEGAARELMIDAQFEYDQEINDARMLMRELEGDVCSDCGGIITTDTTPSYVFKEKDICNCEPLPTS